MTRKSNNSAAIFSVSSSTSSRRAAVSTTAAAAASSDVEVTRKELADGASVELTVIVPASAVEAAWQAAMARARKGSNVPGFRKGAKVRWRWFLIFVERKKKKPENSNEKKLKID